MGETFTLIHISAVGWVHRHSICNSVQSKGEPADVTANSTRVGLCCSTTPCPQSALANSYGFRRYLSSKTAERFIVNCSKLPAEGNMDEGQRTVLSHPQGTWWRWETPRASGQADTGARNAEAFTLTTPGLASFRTVRTILVCPVLLIA